MFFQSSLMAVQSSFAIAFSHVVRVLPQLEMRFLRSQHRGGSSLCFATEVTRTRLTPGGWRAVSMLARQQRLNRDDCR